MLRLLSELQKVLELSYFVIVFLKNVVNQFGKGINDEIE